MFKCEQCASTFTRKNNLVRHGKTHTGIHFPCTICQSTFTYKTNLTKHLKNVHGIVPALRQPYAQLDQLAAPIDAQSTRQGDIQIAPQIFVPDIPAGGSNEVSEDDVCMLAMDEYEKQDAITVVDLKIKEEEMVASIINTIEDGNVYNNTLSIKGTFSWETFEGYQVPWIIRVMNGEYLKFVSVRMAERDLLKSYLKILHKDMHTCTSIKSKFIDVHEAKLLNEINQHADYAYGKYTFVAGKDLIVTLEDAQEFYTFMDVCIKKLQCKITPGCNDKCGFIRINSESTVPYCTKDGKQFVPMFYFNGVTESTMSLAVKLENWDLAYLKFCCKVQGIKTELYNFDSCKSIDLDYIKSCSSESSFHEYWPIKLIDTHLLANQQSNHVNPSGVWVRAPLEVVHDENTIPSPLTEPAPPITQSIQNTYQYGWPENKLVNSYTIQPQTQPQPPSTDLRYSVGTSNQNVAPRCYNTCSTMSQGSRSRDDAGHVVRPTHFAFPAAHTSIWCAILKRWTKKPTYDNSARKQLSTPTSAVTTGTTAKYNEYSSNSPSINGPFWGRSQRPSTSKNLKKTYTSSGQLYH